MPLLAYGYYKKAGYQKRIDEIFQRMIWAFSQWIGADKFKTQPTDPIAEVSSTPSFPDASEFQIHPLLRQTALDILKKKRNPNLNFLETIVFSKNRFLLNSSRENFKKIEK